jgi:hypothetical protein
MGCAAPNGADVQRLSAVLACKDQALNEAHPKVRRLWALAWLAKHAEDSGLVGFNSDEFAEAQAVVMDEIIRLSLEVRAALARRAWISPPSDGWRCLTFRPDGSHDGPDLQSPS